jgi:short-subunit dehydrogenase
LVNNAGYGEFGKVENQSLEQIEEVMRTNYLGMFYCTKVFLQSRHSGHIVNIASLAASSELLEWLDVALQNMRS